MVRSVGGGVFCDSSSAPILTNCTFTDNLGPAFDTNGKGGTLTNCILWGDQGGEFVFTTSTVTYSDVMGGYTGVGNINANPQFVSGTDQELMVGSPCINTGSNSALPANITIDLAGNSRIVNGVVDMGGYEFQPYLWYGLGDGISWNDAANWPRPPQPWM